MAEKRITPKEPKVEKKESADEQAAARVSKKRGGRAVFKRGGRAVFKKGHGVI